MLKNVMELFLRMGGGVLKILCAVTWGKEGSKIAKIILT